MTEGQIESTTDWLEKHRVHYRVEGRSVLALESIEIPADALLAASGGGA